MLMCDHLSNQYQCRLRNSMLCCGVIQGLHCAQISLFLRPRRLIHNRCRSIPVISPGNQPFAEFPKHPGAQVNRHRGLMRGKALNPLLLRNRCPSLQPCNNKGLCDSRQCIFQIQRCRCSKAGTHTRTAFIGNSHPIQLVHLLSDCPIDAGISRMKPDSRLLLLRRLPDHSQHLFQRHPCAVVYRTFLFCILQQLRID